MIRLRRAFLLFACVVSAAFAQGLPAINVAWLPVSDAERAIQAPVVEAGAGAEALFWRVHVLDERLSDGSVQRVLYHYVRLKVFNDEGMKKAATVDIPFDDRRTSILFIDGRTIKADGTALDLDKRTIRERDLVRASGLKYKVKSFAMPGVEPGAIVEYRWKEIRHNSGILYTRLQLQRDIPIHRVTYFIKPLSRDLTTYRMGVWPFHCKTSPLKLENDGFNSTFLENVPAFKDEPFMPSEPNVRPWILIFYHDGKKREQEKYWNEIGREIYNDLKFNLKTNGEMRQAAAAAVAGAEDDEAKVVALIRYLRKNFRDLFDAGVTDTERAKIVNVLQKRSRTSVEVFKSGIGTPNELNTLYAALASEAGLEARPARVASRNDLYFVEQLNERYFLPNIDMAVKIGDQWKVFDVSARLLPPGQLFWFEEGVRALIADPKNPFFITTPLSLPQASQSVRNGKLALGEDGSLEGEIEEIFTGHSAATRRRNFEDESEARQQEELKERVQAVFPQAEVSEIVIENADDPEKPLTIRYRVQIPGYAQRTGRRLLFQPFYFQRGSSPLFSAGERMHDIFLEYGWKETDNVTITLPEGFTFDNPESPGDVNFGEPGSYRLAMATRGDRELVCMRELIFGKDGMIVFSKNVYPQLKKVFDEIHSRDSHLISARQVSQ